MIRWRVFVGVAAAFLLGACDVPVSGSAAADDAALRAMANAPVTSTLAFGHDASTVDPCSVVNVSALPAGLNAALQAADAFDRCPVTVTQDDGTKVNVEVGPLETLADKPWLELTQVATLSRGIKLETDATTTPGFCYTYLQFTDGVLLEVSANTVNTDSKANVCPGAQALARNAAGAILAGAVKHVQFPARSIAKLDPCDFVSGGVLARAGLAGANPHAYPEHHQCTWLLPGDLDTKLRLTFGVGTTPKVIDPSTDTASQIAGRQSVTTKLDQFCFMETGLNTSRPDNEVEVAYVSLSTPTSSTLDPCTASQTVATAAWPQLPNG